MIIPTKGEREKERGQPSHASERATDSLQFSVFIHGKSGPELSARNWVSRTELIRLYLREGTHTREIKKRRRANAVIEDPLSHRAEKGTLLTTQDEKSPRAKSPTKLEKQRIHHHANPGSTQESSNYDCFCPMPPQSKVKLCLAGQRTITCE